LRRRANRRRRWGSLLYGNDNGMLMVYTLCTKVLTKGLSTLDEEG
jgi:hypothetical protein